MTNAEYLKSLRAAAKENGQCSICRARRADVPLLTCSDCREATREQRLRNRKKGLCICGKARVKGRTRCKRCIANHRENSARKVAEQVSSGLCSVPCCKRGVVSGRSRCGFHLVRDAQRMTRRRWERLARGLCPTCPRAVETGLASCRRCLDRMSEWQRSYYAQQKEAAR